MRGRSVSFGLAVVGSACASEGPGPVSEVVEVHEDPVVETVEGVRRVHNRGPVERLIVYEQLPAGGVTLLFLHGRSATPTEDGGSAWADMEGGRVVVFDRDGVVQQVLGDRPAEGPPLTQPAFVAFDDHALLAVEIDGSMLGFSGGRAQRWLPPSTPGALVGGAGRPLAAARTVFDLQLVPLAPDEPLLWISDGAEAVPTGRISMPEQAMLAPLVNSGWVAPSRDGSVLFASAVRPELQRFGEDRAAEWVATWSREGVSEPVFGISSGTLVPRFRLVHQAVVEGPDGRTYALVTRGEDGPADRLLVFERDGRLLRAGEVDPRAAIYVARTGHVYSADPPDALGRTEAVASASFFDSFELPSLDGPGEVRLEDHRGKVVVVNFWASWCAPCRQEMPLLDELAGELDPRRAVVIGLNEDVAPGDALRFLRELGGVRYPVAEGRGRLKDRYGYRGLPYTVVVDPEGRMVKAFYGFGTSIDPIRNATVTAIASADRPR